MVKWWGRGDWRRLIGFRSIDIAEQVRARFRADLGYKHVAAYPICESKKTNRIMYYMIHASDHEEAPGANGGGALQSGRGVANSPSAFTFLPERQALLKPANNASDHPQWDTTDQDLSFRVSLVFDLR